MEDPAISGGQGQLALDLSPRPPADTTARFIEYLRSEPSPTEVAQELVLGFLSEFDARASVISAVESDATLSVLGHFGISPAAVASFGACSLWDRLPAAVAIRQREPLVMPTSQAVAAAFPAMRDTWPVGHALIDAPLLTASSVVGSVFVQLEAEGAKVASAAQVLEALTDVYVLYLLANSQLVTTAHHPAPSGGDVARAQVASPPTPAGISSRTFSKRQKFILEFLGDGLTYDQIAARIGYSHSTVRMELMRMYRALGVESRRDAVEAARRQGLIGDPLTASAASHSHRGEQAE